MESPVATPPAPDQTCPLAIWSLILSILGCTCLFLFGSIPGIILGHKALARIKASGGTLTGGGMATAGLVIGYIGLGIGLIMLILAGLLFPAINQAKTRAKRAQSMGNLKQIGLAVMLYQSDYDETPPPSFKALDKYIGGQGNSKIFICPGTDTVTGDWDDVDAWSDYQLVTNADTRMASESVRAFTKPHCYPDEGGIILYQDGHVSWAQKDDYDRLTLPFR